MEYTKKIFLLPQFFGVYRSSPGIRSRYQPACASRTSIRGVSFYRTPMYTMTWLSKNKRMIYFTVYKFMIDLIIQIRFTSFQAHFPSVFLMSAISNENSLSRPVFSVVVYPLDLVRYGILQRLKKAARVLCLGEDVCLLQNSLDTF